MKRRHLFAFLFAAVAIAMSAIAGGSFAAPFSKMAPALFSSNASALTKVQYACGWTYSCTNLGNESSGSRPIQIYGPVNVYTGADVKPEIWRVPEGAWAWTGQDNQDSQTWRGWGCGGYPCDEKCGAFCWFNRVRNGYCGHGCDVYREHVMFQPINGNIRPYVYRKTPDCDYGYGPRDGYGYGPGSALGPCRYGYASGGGFSQTSSVQEGYYPRYGYASGGGYGQTSSVQEGYYPPSNGAGGAPPPGYPQNAPPPGYPQNSPPPGYPQNAPQGPYGGPAPAPGGERFVDRLRRFFYGGQPYRDTAANGTVQFERPSSDLVPLRRFNGPKYPPTCNGKNC